MTLPNEVKYVPFGGVQVPENLKRNVVNQNGKQMYCVWTDNKGGKVMYPMQQKFDTNDKIYQKEYAIEGYKPRTEYTTQAEYSLLKMNAFLSCEGKKDNNAGIKYAYWPNGVDVLFTKDGKYEGRWTITSSLRDTTPTINISKDSGLIFDTQNVTLSNMRNATVYGSSNEDNILLDNSDNCTVDVSKDNNNRFVSDTVTILNGKGNKVVAGDHDTVTVQTHNYDTNEIITDKKFKGEGTHKQ